MSVYFAGFLLSLSLILAIGSQNAFVLKQGLKNQHVLLVCTICAVSDAILILLGVGGFGLVVKQFPAIEVVARYGGAFFLGIYALLSFRSAFTQSNAFDPSVKTEYSVVKVIVICLAFTWLNPHVYLDTLVLLGSVSTQYAPRHWVFGFGAMTASFLFFFSLGYGARRLAPLFRKPHTWRVLDFFVGVTMAAIAFSLLSG